MSPADAYRRGRFPGLIPDEDALMLGEEDADDDESEDEWQPRYPDPAALEPVPDYVLCPHAYDCHTQLLRGMLLMQAERWVDVWGKRRRRRRSAATGRRSSSACSSSCRDRRSRRSSRSRRRSSPTRKRRAVRRRSRCLSRRSTSSGGSRRLAPRRQLASGCSARTSASQACARRFLAAAGSRPSTRRRVAGPCGRVEGRKPLALDYEHNALHFCVPSGRRQLLLARRRRRQR